MLLYRRESPLSHRTVAAPAMSQHRQSHVVHRIHASARIQGARRSAVHLTVAEETVNALSRSRSDAADSRPGL
jgi:hypothetical protein